jgi:biopolymer transport protein ExbD
MSTAVSEQLNTDEAVGDEGPAVQRRRMPEDSEVDMTPMIDCVFLLNIFFILTFNSDPSKSNLAPSKTGTVLDPHKAVMVTIAEGTDGASLVYLGAGKQGSPLPADEASQREIVLAHLQQGVTAGKTMFAIQADRGVKEGDIDRVANLINEVEGLTLHFPVQEVPE